MCSARRCSSMSASVHSRRGCATANSAFSLVELLVVIGVIGVLIAITVPALTGARAAARQTVCLANLRGIGVTFETFLNSSAQRYPFAPAGTRLATTPIPPGEPGSGAVIADHWAPTLHWPALVADVAPWREHYGSWVCPGAPRADGATWDAEDMLGPNPRSGPSYMYSTSFMARPSLWSGSSAPDPALLAPVLSTDVARPANKVLMFDAEMAHLSGVRKPDRDARPMLFADGHAAVHRYSRASEPVLNPIRGSMLPLNDTRDGAAGSDY